MRNYDSKFLEIKPVQDKYCRYLYKVFKTMATVSKETTVLSILTENAVETLGVKASSIRLLDERGEELELVCACGLSDQYLEKGPVKVEKSLVDKEALEGRAVIIDDVARDPRWQYHEEAEREGIRSALCVPLTVKEKKLGTMRVYSFVRRRFKEEEARYLYALANIGAISIERLHLQQKMEKRYENMQILIELSQEISSNLKLKNLLDSITTKAVETLGVKASSIRLLDERGEELELVCACGLSDQYLEKGPVKVEKSLVDKEALEGRAVIIDDVARDPRWQYHEEAEREGIRSALCVPLTVKEKKLGTMRVYTGEPHRFDEEEVFFLKALSNYATIAIKNSRLYELTLKTYRRLVEEHMGEKDYWE